MLSNKNHDLSAIYFPLHHRTRQHHGAIRLHGESVVSSWRRIAPWCCLVRWCRGKYIADKSWFLLLSTRWPHLLELSLIWNLLELVDGRCFFRQSTLERDVMENTVQAGTPAKVSKHVTWNRTLSDLSVISVTVGYLDVVWMCSDIY